MIFYYRKLFLPFGNLTLISVNTKIFMETHDEPMEQERCFGKIVFHPLLIMGYIKYDYKDII